MGKKVNYNKKNKVNNLKILGIAFFIIFFILILISSIRKVKNGIILYPQSEESSLVYKNLKDYETLEALINSYNCQVISKEESNVFVKVKLNFDVGLYTGDISNETHFLNICKAIAEFIDYKDFELVDDSKNIDIEVKCEDTNIVEFKINGDVNYYLNSDSQINRKLSKNITNFTIQSKELQELIDENWNEKNVNFGTKDSTCNGYSIFFDEGIKYRTVATDIFNIVFTSKYNGQIAGGLTTNSTPEEVESALGTPTFSNNSTLYGYVSDSSYLFFDFTNKQISLYPVVEVAEEDEAKLKALIEKMNESSDIKAFATDITGLWNDYDEYDYDSNYVNLTYTLKGVQLSISSDSLKNGVFIYQNYSGNRDITNLENVYMQGTDCVFEVEKNRSDTEAMSRIDQGDFTDEYYRKYLGENFSVKFQDYKENIKIGPKFYSRDESYPDSELDKRLEISSYIWLNEYIYIYSVDNEGIYAYNCNNRQRQKLLECEGEIIINDVENNQLIYNDTERLTIVVE